MTAYNSTGTACDSTEIEFDSLQQHQIDQSFLILQQRCPLNQPFLIVYVQAESALRDKAETARQALAVHPDATALLPAVIGHFRTSITEGSTAALLEMVAGAVRKMSDQEVRKSSIHNRFVVCRAML